MESQAVALTTTITLASRLPSPLPIMVRERSIISLARI
jgi:hypothetical protein